MTFAGISVVARNHFHIQSGRWLSSSCEGQGGGGLTLQVPEALRAEIQSKEKVHLMVLHHQEQRSVGRERTAHEHPT